MSELRHCLHCTRPFPVTTVTESKKFCQPACRTAWHLAERKAALELYKTSDQPVAWSFQLANSMAEDGTYCNWGPTELSFWKPSVPEGSIRNLKPLYDRSPQNG